MIDAETETGVNPRGSAAVRLLVSRRLLTGRETRTSGIRWERFWAVIGSAYHLGGGGFICSLDYIGPRRLIHSTGSLLHIVRVRLLPLRHRIDLLPFHGQYLQPFSLAGSMSHWGYQANAVRQ